MKRAACGRCLCETQTLMKADKQHKPVGNRKHWAGNHKLHYKFAVFPPQTSTLKTSLLFALLATKGSGQLKGRFKGDSEEKT